MVDRTIESYINELIRSMHDSVAGYTKAAELADSESYRQLFIQLGNRRSVFLKDLQALEVAVGGSPVEDGTMQGMMFRKFKELSLNFAGDKDLVILNAVQEVLGDTIAQYQSILDDKLNVTQQAVRDLLTSQHDELVGTQAHIESLISQHEDS